MDSAIIGLLVIAAIVAAVVYYGRPRPAVPLDELLSRLGSIAADPKLTAVQRHHEAEMAYRAYESREVSLIGKVDDVFPGGSIIMQTSARDLPRVGVELSRASPEQLRALEKGKVVTLRARLPAWKAYSDIADLPAGFHGAKVFCGGRWYGVKGTYRVTQDPKPALHPNMRTVELKRTS
jgi:hypothetical protein